MSQQIRLGPMLSTMTLLAVVTFYGFATSFAQNSNGDVELHANSHVSAASIGLPVYPGAAVYKDKGNDSGGDLALIFGNFHFSLKAINYVTKDSPEQVLNFYRKPLSHYGEVLECDHGKPVGSLTVTRSGLTCGSKDNEGSSSYSSSGHEIRAGSPQKFRIVGIDDSHSGATRFGLVYLEVPKDSGEKVD